MRLVEREEPIPPFGEADVLKRGDDLAITLGGEEIMVITPADAADVLATPQELALEWGGEMAHAVAEARDVRANPLSGAGILIRNSFRDLIRSGVQALPRLAGMLAIWLLFYVLAKVITWIVVSVARLVRLDPNLRQLARAVTYYGVWVIGLIAMLGALGLESGSIVAALGISGFVLGFAFKDILSHFLAGLMLLLGRQFRIGDQIVVKEFEGTVERIELRAMHLRTYDNRLVIIPNAEVFNATVTSNTASPYRRRDFIVGIDYEADIGQARKIALDTVRSTPGVIETPAPDILIDELAASTVNLRIRFYVNSTRADYMRVGSEVMRRLKMAFDRAGIPMPTDILTVVVRKPSGVAASLMGETDGDAPSETGGDGNSGALPELRA